MSTSTESTFDTAAHRDVQFVQILTNTVTRNPEWELDQLTSYLINQCMFPRVYVDQHLQAITAAMMKARGEL